MPNDPSQSPQQMIKTNRLIMRSFRLVDVPYVESLLEDPTIPTGSPSWTLPHKKETIDEWILKNRELFERGELYGFAVFRAEGSKLIGYAGLRVDTLHARAEISCWIGAPYRKQGMGTEACRALIRFGFNSLGLEKIFSLYATDQIDIKRMWKKLGMRKEATLRKHIKRGDERVDEDFFGLLSEEYWVLQFTDPKITSPGV